MSNRDDEAWRQIVEHYGDRPVLDEPPAPPVSEPFRFTFEVDDESFVPPPIEPASPTSPERRAAWVAFALAPMALLVSAVLHWQPAAPVTLLLVALFLGAFGFLVATMSHEPRDPYDDGARL